MRTHTIYKFALKVTLLLLAFSASHAAEAASTGTPPTDHAVKGALIRNFAKFVTWPSAGPDPLLCVADDPEFARYMEALHVPLLSVRIPASEADVENCSLLFLSSGDAGHDAAFVEHSKHHPVLTISPAEGFADHGGIIELATAAKTIGLFSRQQLRLRINLDNAHENGIGIDARLLQVAAEVIKNK